MDQVVQGVTLLSSLKECKTMVYTVVVREPLYLDIRLVLPATP